MNFVTRKRLVGAGIVIAVVAVFAVIGAVSRSSPVASTPVTTTVAGGASAPSASWYWTMVVSPSDANVLVLGTSSGLVRSTNGGKTWQPTGPKNIDATSLVQDGSSLFVGGTSAKPFASPVIEKHGARAVADGASVLATSTDSGSSWKALHPKGLPKNAAIQALAVDAAAATSLYALLNTGKLYRSTDGAQSFQLVSAKTGVPPWALAITADGHFIGGDMDTGTSQSTNGKGWRPTAFSDSRGTHMVMEFAVEPGESTHILMSAYGLEMSTDAGKSWHVALKSNVMFGPVAWAPSTPEVAYAVGFDSSIWRSRDGGKTWTKIS